MRRVVGALVIPVVLVATLAGCTRRDEVLGAGPETDVCFGFAEINDFTEPDPTDPAELERWARGVARVLDRIDVERAAGPDRTTPSPAMAEGVTLMRAEIGDFIDALDSVDDHDGGAATVDAALSRLMGPAFSETYDAAIDEGQEICR